MGEIEELRRRLEALEAQVHDVVEQQAIIRHLAVSSDRDVAALQEQRRADRQLFHALRETQLEHGKTLREHSELLGVLVKGQIEHGKILAEHTKVLGEHSKTLGEHSTMLRSLAAGQAAILDHLGITPPEQPQEG
ncbi:hypothetical protein [Streptomyces capitiformicae]|uniref:Uncharacterized protein n=1 Tax=Streptomyces capitiformicae TaxID=2014920 RepID=A0A919GH19_9ACTN|nr:hypothetical protein [Streptomyces capitiformicae]GHH83924.1 hypothetical protein GCM10017771_11760 [Streptomyces capitiformicae]